MSWLAPIPLEGIGTECVESLSSYIVRIAHVHGVSPLKVHKLICSSPLQNEAGPAVKYGAFRLPSLAAYSEATKTYVARLEVLTRQTNLTCGTLLKLAPMLAPNGIGAVYGRLRWCPECFSRPDESSELLIWQLVTSHVCPRDGCGLVISCEQCGAARAPLRSLDKRRFCFRCRHDLGGTVQKRAPIGQFRMWQQRQSERLVQLVAEPTWAGVEANGLRQIVDALGRESTIDRRSRQEQMPLLTRVLKRIRKRNAAPQLVSIFLAAAELGVSARSIFETPLITTQARLLEGVPQGRPRYATRRVAIEAKERLAQAMLQILKEDIGVPPTLNQLCGAAGMRASTFYQFDRQTYQQYASFRKEKAKGVREARTSRAFWTAFFLEVARCRENSHIVDVREIGRAISSVTGASKYEAEAMLHAGRILATTLGSSFSPNFVDSVMFRRG